MQYKLKSKGILAICLVIVMSFTIMSSTFFSSAKSTEELKAELEQIEKDREKAEDELDDLKGNIKAEQEVYDGYFDDLKQVQEDLEKTRTKIADLDTKIQTKEDTIKVYNLKIEQMNENILIQTAEIKIKEDEANEVFLLLKERMRAVYMAGDTSTIEILLTSKDFSDFLTKCDFVKGIAEYDAQLISQIQEIANDLKIKREALEEDKNANVKLQEQVAKDLVQLSKDKASADAQRLIEEALEIQKQNLLDESAAKLDDLSDAEKALKSQLSDYDTDQKMIEELLNPPVTGGSSSDASTGSGSSIGMMWPVQGCSTYVSSPYGPRWGTIHYGMDIAGGSIYGKPIVAVADGTVILALNTTVGYGKYVIVDHGNGVATLYAHSSKLLVSVGDKVSQGETIALVGSTGNSTGPHLHFEVRINGQRMNPANYL